MSDRRVLRRAAVCALACALALSLVGPGSTLAGLAPHARPRAKHLRPHAGRPVTTGLLTEGPITSPLTRTGAWMTDNQGRVVILHGVNIIKKLAPFYPANITGQDASFLADEGLDAARIGFIWAGAEPSPGVYDNAYIAKVVGFNALLARYGIRTFVDTHQDDWGPSNSGDGAPAWASLGTSTGADFEDFWNNTPGPGGVGIQTRLDALWTVLAKALDASSASENIAGLDPFNEPNPGSGYAAPCTQATPCPAFESGQLTQFYDKLIPAIRAAGDTHIIFPEGISQHAGFEPALGGFADSQVAYSWHYYCLPTELTSNPADAFSAYCDSTDPTAFADYDAYGKAHDVPLWVGEFGANDADSEYAQEVDDMDADFMSWTYWAYNDPSGDPSDSSGQGILLNNNAPGSLQNAKLVKLDALVVPYAEATAGTPLTYRYDRSTDVMTDTYSTQAAPGATLVKGALTQIFVPQIHYPTGYSVAVIGGTVVSSPTSPWLEITSDSDASQVEVTVSPATGSSTELPSQTGKLPVSGP
jgi:endoglycosylceramidase